MWLDEWFRNYIQPSSKIKTCERYSEIIEKHLKVKLGEYELDELTPLVLQRYVTGLMQSGNIVTGKGLAANSVNGIITVIQNSLKLAYTLGELKEYTADKIKRPKTKEKEVSCFSLAEQKKIEQAALSSKKRKFIGIVICLYSGLRIGELLALTWSDIDFTKGTLAVNKTCHDGRDEKGNLCRITDLPKRASCTRIELLEIVTDLLRQMIRHSKQALSTKSQTLAFHSSSDHFKSLARTDTVSKQRITAKHCMSDSIFLMIMQMNVRSHHRERKSRTVKLTGTDTIEQLIITLHNSFTADRIFEDPRLESLANIVSLALYHTGSINIHHTLFLSIAQAVRHFDRLVDLRLLQIQQMLKDVIAKIRAIYAV